MKSKRIRNLIEPEVWSKALDAFVANKIEKRRLSSGSEKHYRNVLAIKAAPRPSNFKGRYPAKPFFRWCEINRKKKPQAAAVESYLQYLKMHGINLKTVNKVLFILRSFFRFLNERELYKNNVHAVESYNLPGADDRHSRPYVSPELFKKLLASIEPGSLAGARDRAIIAIAFTSGARIGSILALLKKDFRHVVSKGEFYLFFRQLKRRLRGETDRLPGAAGRLVLAYLEVLEKNGIVLGGNDPLFFSLAAGSWQKRLTISGLSTIIKNRFKALVKSGELHESELAGLCAHSLKHGFVSLLFSKGYSLEEIRRGGGKHLSQRSTLRYLHTIESEQMAQKLETVFDELTGFKPMQEAGENVAREGAAGG